MSVESFASDLEQAADALEMAIGDVVSKVGFDVLSNASGHTPVDRGTASGNWAITEGAQPEYHLDESATGPETSIGTFAQLPAAKPFRTLWVSNFLPYIEVLEFGGYGAGPKTVGGFSRLAPAGMLRVALAEVEVELEDAVDRAIRGAGF